MSRRSTSMILWVSIALLAIATPALPEADTTAVRADAFEAVGAPPNPDPHETANPAGEPRQATGAPADQVEREIRLLRAGAEPISWTGRLTSLGGLVVLMLIAWLLSSRRDVIHWRVILWGVSLQLIFAVLVLKTAPGRAFFSTMNDVVVTLLGFTADGARFIFGNLIYNNVPVGTPLGSPTMGPIDPATQSGWAATGGFFAFNVLPTIIFFSSLMALLYYIGLMPLLVRSMAWIMHRTMRTSGAESLSAAANVFVGQTEAPLVIRPYIEAMTVSELNAVMTGGFATVAGGVMAAYVGMLSGYFPEIAGHLIAASVMSAPAALVIAKLMLPETEKPQTEGGVRIHIPKEDVNVIDAAARGAAEGLRLALNVGAMLLAFLGLLYMSNYLFGLVGARVGIEELSIQLILGWIFYPMAWIMGVPAADCMVVGQLLGEKLVLTEFIAYANLGALLGSTDHELSYRSVVIATYALCGFANFGSIAIQLGGIGGLAPSRRHDLARVGLRAMIAGLLAANMTATVAGLLI